MNTSGFPFEGGSFHGSHFSKYHYCSINIWILRVCGIRILRDLKMESSRDVAADVPDAVDAAVDAAVQILKK